MTNRRALWVVGLSLALVVGCSVAARDRVKHFFFDIPAAAGESPAEVATSPPAEVARPQAFVLPPPRYASRHQAVLDGNCRSCHDPQDNMQVADQLMLESCRTCHPRYFGAEVGHAPVAAGECRSCHTLHRSTQPHLLLLSVFETCIECHDEPEDLSENAHGGDDVENCSACHDPHFGQGPLLKAGVPWSPAEEE